MTIFRLPGPGERAYSPGVRRVAAVLAFGLLAGCASTPRRGSAHEILNATLWMQTSAEYDALARSTFAAATRALGAALADPAWTAALEQAGDFAALPPAVVVDVDETVLDNSPFEAQTILEDTSFCSATWSAWVEKSSARPLPGATAFLADAVAKGADVFYVTNRTSSEKERTIANLAAAGFPHVDAAHVLTSGETPADGGPAWTSEKATRRAFLAARHRIVLLLGDDLRDFVPVPAGASLEDRVALSRRYAERWGTRWFLLPNAIYGSWERALTSTATGEAAVLAAKRSRVKGFRDPVASGCASR